MTWEPIDNLNLDEIIELSWLVLYGAVDGVDGADWDILETNPDYWRGSLETSARTLAFIFAGSAKYAQGEGIAIGDAVGFIKTDMTEAAKFLVRPSEKSGDAIVNTKNAERCVERALLRFFEVYADEDITVEAAAILTRRRIRNNKMREASRRNQRVALERLREAERNAR